MLLANSINSQTAALSDSTSFYGYLAGGISTGIYNAAFGYESLANCTAGYENSAGGYQAGFNIIGGYENTVWGSLCGGAIVSGYGNCYFGNNAGSIGGDRIRCVGIGQNANPSHDYGVCINYTAATTNVGDVYINDTIPTGDFIVNGRNINLASFVDTFKGIMSADANGSFVKTDIGTNGEVVVINTSAAGGLGFYSATGLLPALTQGQSVMGVGSTPTAVTNFTDSSNRESIDWQNRFLKTTNGDVVGSWLLCRLFDYGTNNAFSIDWNAHALYRNGTAGVGDLTVDYTNCYLVNPSTASNTLEWVALTMIDNSAKTSINWGNRYLYYSSGTVVTLNWEICLLTDNNNVNSVTWLDRYLYSSSNQILVAWDDQLLFDDSGSNLLSANWGLRILYDTGAHNSLDWTNRELIASGGSTVQLNWATAGTLTSSAELALTKTTNQIVLGTTNTTTLDFIAPSSSITFKWPNTVGTSGYVLSTDGANPATLSWIAPGGGGGPSFVNVTTTTQAMAVNTNYLANNAALVTLTLPTTAAQGTLMSVAGFGAGGWLIAQNSGQSIHLGSSQTTVGAGGSLASSNQFDSITLLCAVANTTWVVQCAPQGNITVV